MLKRYRTTLELKDSERLLPYHLDDISIELDAETLIEACEKAEVYLSTTFGASFIVNSAYEIHCCENPEELGAPGDDIVDDD